VERLALAVREGEVSHSTAALKFGKQLEAELAQVACSWEVCLWDLKHKVDAMSSSAIMTLRNGPEDSCQSPLRPLYLLEALHEWLPVAALADDLRQHRLVQITGVVKIEKKFVKVVGMQPRAGFTAAELLARSALSGCRFHDLCAQVEAFGDLLLESGLKAEGHTESTESQLASMKSDSGETCSICLSTFTDPACLPCGHRFCIQCVLPLFGALPDLDEDEVVLRCPLCRAASPQVPEALCLDSLIGCFARGLSPSLKVDMAEGSHEKMQQLTAVVVSSLARLLAGDARNEEHVKNALLDISSPTTPETMQFKW
jgi:hypothetical protein